MEYDQTFFLSKGVPYSWKNKKSKNLKNVKRVYPKKKDQRVKRIKMVKKVKEMNPKQKIDQGKCANPNATTISFL